MNEKPKKLPFGVSTFSEMIEDDYIYVDKTKIIYNLIESGKKYFLSRPRRFGKSLLISTMEELFEGNKKLFESLYIYDKWDWSQSYPVLHLDMSGLRVKTPEIFENSLNNLVDELAEDYSINFIYDEVKGKFGELIKKISIKTKKKVVILVDEYDFPIIDNMSNLDVAEANRETLSEFYQVLKNKDKYIRFIFLTGVSKFVKTSVFSKLNHLDDISIDPRYSSICGYREEDLEKHFTYYIKNLSESQGITYDDAIKRIKKCYDGYSWDGENFLYNPSSIISTLSKNKFANYWFNTGTPTFLMDLIKRDAIDLGVFMGSNLYFKDEFPTWDLNNINFTTALLQTGYLTIKSNTKAITGEEQYNLGIPNKEVERSLFNYLLAAYTDNTPSEMTKISDDFLKYLIKSDEDNLSILLDCLVGSVPYHSHMTYWKNYQIFFNGFFSGMGLKMISEKANSPGRIDYVLKLNGLHVIVELKYSQNKTLKNMFDEAWRQIAKKRYYQEYQDKNLKFLTIAIQDTKAKEVQCQIKTLEELKKIKIS
ncbi:MAG: ATP-binding protein [Methanobrevibacter sp.]|nr:ATP-binding protein [Candidatus Methanoflexus mossambicus]